MKSLTIFTWSEVKLFLKQASQVNTAAKSRLPAGTPFDAPRCGIDHLALEVSDLDAVQQRLAALGYPLDEGPIEEDNVRFLLIRGPDGERLEFDACKR